MIKKTILVKSWRLPGLTSLANLTTAAALAMAGAAKAEDTTSPQAGFLGTNLAYSKTMFDRQETVTNKVAFALRTRANGQLQTGKLYVGGRLIASNIWEKTNTAGKFPILSRLPPTHTAGTEDSYGVINDASLNATLTLPWVTVFAQGEHTEVEYTGQADTQLRKVWVAIGDLDRSPFYLAIGKKTVNFGRFETYAPFTHSHNSHYFWAQSDKPILEFGYVTDRTELALTLIPAHRGLRVLSSPNNDEKLTNYALNGSHRIDLSGGRSLTLGAGYLRGTIYDSTIAHHPPSVGINRSWNGAFDVNATFSTPKYDLQVEHTWTEDTWPATGHRVSSTTLQGRYRTEIAGRSAVVSLSVSRGVQGASGTQWERMDQAILGLEVDVAKNVQLGFEYMFNKGFVPLIMPTIAGDRDVKSHTFIAGLKMTF